MRAAVFLAPDQPLVVETRPDPAPRSGEIVIRVGRCGICGSDLHMSRDEGYARPQGFVFGHEFAGEVVALGAGVATLSVGDRVAQMPVTGCGGCDACAAGNPAYCVNRRLVHGGYAEFALGRAREALVLDDCTTDADGALMEPFAVALHGVRLAEAPPGARVLVVGAGPIGLATAFWALRDGASRVVVGARSTRSADLAARMGASGFVVADEDLPERAVDALRGAPNVIYECTGAAGLIDRCIGTVAMGGTIIVQGINWQRDTIRPRVAIGKEVRLQFSAFFSLADYRTARDVISSDPAVPRAMVSATVGLDELPERFAELRRGGSLGKVLIDPWTGGPRA